MTFCGFANSSARYLAIGIASLSFIACSSGEDSGGNAGSDASSGSGGDGGGATGGSSGATGGTGGGMGGDSGGTGGATGGTGGGSGGTGGTGGGSGGTGGSSGWPPRSMGFIGCSMAENVAQGYQDVGGMRMWPPYGTGALVVQEWTDTNSSAWQKFDAQAATYGEPTAVWVQICIFESRGADYDEVKQLIANAREHAAPGATIYVSGQPLYEQGSFCFLAGANGPQLTDDLAQQAAADSTQNVIYPGTFGPLGPETTLPDGCHANSPAGEELLGNQAVDYFGP